MPAPRTSPASDNDGADYHGQVDNHAHPSPPQFVSREATVGIATTASITITRTLGDGLLMQIQGFDSCRHGDRIDDKENNTTARNNTAFLIVILTLYFSLCDH
jgi:hypothetical protein